MNYFLRNNETDFTNWYRHIVPMVLAKLKAYEKDSIKLILHNDEYYDMLIVKSQLTFIRALLDKEHSDFFESYIMKKQLPEWGDKNKRKLYDDIFHYWQQVCFPDGKSRIKDLDPVLLGGELKRLRISRSMSIKQVAELIGISRKALYAYEEGIREMRASTLYKLSQVYKIDIEDAVKHCYS